MTLSLDALAAIFVLASCASLGASTMLVRSLEGLAARWGLSEAGLGLTSALAANSPEITSAVAALVQGQYEIGTGVVLGSNVFNLAALLGLGALVAGAIRLHRRVVVLAGGVGVWVAICALAVVGGVLDARLGLVVVLLIFVPYVAIAAAPQILHRLPLPATWSTGIRRAVLEEEGELAEAIRPHAGGRRDAAVTAGTLFAVIIASVVMERSASTIGARYHVPTIVVGGLVLAAVTSLPNAVAAVYLAGRGRGTAVLSEAMNSNTLNVVVGLLIPASLTGLTKVSSRGGVIAAAFAAGLTLVALGLAYRGHGLGRWSGGLLVAGYLGFVATIATG